MRLSYEANVGSVVGKQITDKQKSMKTKTAHRDGHCSWCQQTITTGNELFPVLETVCNLARALSTNVSQTTSTANSRQCFWIHADCAITVFKYLNKPVEPPACRHWIRIGQCPFQEQCFFLHPQDITNHLPPEKRTWGGKRRKLFKPTFSIFRAWLLQTFGHDHLLSSSSSSSTTSCRSVLDIAGGKGTLAFELENLSGIRTCVIDPRPLTLRRAYRKWKSRKYDKAANNPVLNECLTHYNPQVPPNYPAHLRVFFNTNLIEKVEEYLHHQQKLLSTTTSDKEHYCYQQWWQQCRDCALQQAWTRKGLERGEAIEEESIDDAWLANVPQDVQDATKALSILCNCSAVVGMHPDQATEAAVDFALALNKPFAVVPCCVFATQFRHRTLQDGTSVKSTKQLVQYLQEKDPRIRVDTLGFEGMNTVVFMTPDDCAKEGE